MKRENFEFNEEHNPEGCRRVIILAVIWFAACTLMLIGALKYENKHGIFPQTEQHEKY